MNLKVFDKKFDNKTDYKTVNNDNDKTKYEKTNQNSCNDINDTKKKSIIKKPISKPNIDENHTNFNKNDKLKDKHSIDLDLDSDDAYNNILKSMKSSREIKENGYGFKQIKSIDVNIEKVESKKTDDKVNIEKRESKKTDDKVNIEKLESKKTDDKVNIEKLESKKTDDKVNLEKVESKKIKTNTKT